VRSCSFYPPIRDADGGYPATEGEVATEDDGIPNVTRENPLDAKFVREYYFKVNPQYEGRFTVPILWDTKQNKIVNNESR
jgi:putative glutathione S-transferase